MARFGPAQPRADRRVTTYVAMAWLIFLALLGLAVLAGTLVGLLLHSAVVGSLVAGAIIAFSLWQRHYRWMT
jgi:hypothetical protein